MSEFTSEDQWRSFQTFVAVYLAGMLHPRDILTISRVSKPAPPVMEFRCDADGRLRFSIGASSWSDDEDASVPIARDGLNQIAERTVRVLRDDADLSDPSELRLSGSGPASSVAVLARSGFMSGNGGETARKAALHARMSADVDIEGDVIDAAARAVGGGAFAATKSGSIAAIAFAAELARLRSWLDPFSPTPKTGYLVGGQPPNNAESAEPAEGY